MHGQCSNSTIFRKKLASYKGLGRNCGIIKTTPISWVSHFVTDASMHPPPFISDEKYALLRLNWGHHSRAKSSGHSSWVKKQKQNKTTKKVPLPICMNLCFSLVSGNVLETLLGTLYSPLILCEMSPFAYWESFFKLSLEGGKYLFDASIFK